MTPTQALHTAALRSGDGAVTRDKARWRPRMFVGHPNGQLEERPLPRPLFAPVSLAPLSLPVREWRT